MARYVPPEWTEKAVCIDESPELFFPEDGRSRRSIENKARALECCNSCPVLEECREYGIRNEFNGIWGGWGQAEMEVERRRRRALLTRFQRIAHVDPLTQSA